MQVTACTSFSIAISNEGISTDFRDLHRRSNETAPFYNWLGSAAAAAWPIAARAQQSDQPRRIGALMGSDESDPEAQSEITEFQRAFQDLGWTGGHNVRIAYRWPTADTARMLAFAKDLMALQPDVVLATTTPVVAALLHECRTVPIVFVLVTDPVVLLKEITPHLTRATAMFNPVTAPNGGLDYLRMAKAAAPSLAIELNAGPVHDVAEIERVVAAVAREPNGGLMALPEIFLNVHRELIIELTARHRVPAIYQYRYFVTGGGLISYGPDVIDQFARAASYVDRILKGGKPVDLPVRAPTKYEFVIDAGVCAVPACDVVKKPNAIRLRSQADLAQALTTNGPCDC